MLVSKLPLEVRLAKEERSEEVGTRQSDLVVDIAQRDVSVCDIAQARHEVAGLLPSDVCRDEAEAGTLGDAKVGFVFHEVAARPQITQHRSADALFASSATDLVRTKKVIINKVEKVIKRRLYKYINI